MHSTFFKSVCFTHGENAIASDYANEKSRTEARVFLCKHCAAFHTTKYARYKNEELLKSNQRFSSSHSISYNNYPKRLFESRYEQTINALSMIYSLS